MTDFDEYDSALPGELAPIEPPKFMRRALPELPAVPMTGGSWFTKEQDAILRAPTPQELVKLRPDGMIYVEQVEYRQRLIDAFGNGGWFWVQLGPEQTIRQIRFSKRENRDVEVILVCVPGRLFRWHEGQAQYLAQSWGESEFFPHQNPATSLESAKSDSITRCCKDLGMFSDMWRKDEANRMRQDIGKGGGPDAGNQGTSPPEPGSFSEATAPPTCPRCKTQDRKALLQDRDDKSLGFCWIKRGGCGAKFAWSETTAAPEAPAPAATMAPGGPESPATGHKRANPTRKAPGSFSELGVRLSGLLGQAAEYKCKCCGDCSRSGALECDHAKAKTGTEWCREVERAIPDLAKADEDSLARAAEFLDTMIKNRQAAGETPSDLPF